MKRFKKITALILSGLMVFSIAGCRKNVSGVSAEAQESKVAEASIKMKEAKSMKGNMQMDVKMSAEGETMDMTSVSDMVMFNDPFKDENGHDNRGYGRKNDYAVLYAEER